MPYKDREIQRLFYSISEVAKMFNVNISLIRYYETEFDILRPAKNQKGNRFFTPRDIENFKIIFHLVKDLGFTLEGAKKKLHENKAGVESDIELRESLVHLRNFLMELRDAL